MLSNRFRSRVTLLIILASCSHAALLSTPVQAQAPRPATAETAVRAAMDNFVDALNALDVGRMEASFTPDVTAFVPVAKAGYVDGRDSVVAVFQRFVDHVKPTTSRLHLVPEDVRVTVGGDLAVVTFQIRETAPIVRRRTFVFRHVGDRWLISHMHASDLVPPTS